jgi:hypothetical protein
MDYYSEARRIAGLLRTEGLAAEAAEIENTIDGGATASEILMGIRFHLENASPRASATTSRQIASLVEEVSRALG